MPSNYSLYALPAYHLITLAPHAYAVSVMRKANNGKWDNVNPKSANFDASLRKSVPAAIYARYERGKSAHNNGLENMALFYAACLVGNLARLPNETLNMFAGAFLLLRIAYNVVYINNETRGQGFLRTGIWSCSILSCYWMMVKAANVLLHAM